MPEPVTLTILAVTKLAAPTLQGLADLTRALKEPVGKKKLEETRAELAASFENLQRVIIGFEKALQALEQDRLASNLKLEQLQQEVAFLRLPFWKRWTSRKPRNNEDQATS